MRGINWRHGKHQLAQKSTNTTLPRSLESVTESSPAKPVNTNSGAGFPAEGRLGPLDAQLAPVSTSKVRQRMTQVHVAQTLTFFPNEEEEIIRLIYRERVVRATFLCKPG